MPQKSWAVGEEVLAADFNTYLQNQCVPAFTTAAQRDSQWPAPPNGALAVTTDTNTLWQRIAGAWFQPYSVLANATSTGNVAGASPSAVVIITATAFTLPAARRVLVQYTTMSQITSGAGNLSAWNLQRNGTTIRSWETTTGGPGTNTAHSFCYIDAAPSGSLTYRVQFATTVAAAGVDIGNATSPRQLLVMDMGV